MTIKKKVTLEDILKDAPPVKKKKFKAPKSKRKKKEFIELEKNLRRGPAKRKGY